MISVDRRVREHFIGISPIFPAFLGHPNSSLVISNHGHFLPAIFLPADSKIRQPLADADPSRLLRHIIEFNLLQDFKLKIVASVNRIS